MRKSEKEKTKTKQNQKPKQKPNHKSEGKFYDLIIIIMKMKCFFKCFNWRKTKKDFFQ